MQTGIRIHTFFTGKDVIKRMRYIKCFIPLLLFYYAPGNSQQNPDSLSFFYPDTLLSLEKSLQVVEKATGFYFSYNPENLDLEKSFHPPPGWWKLMDFVRWIAETEKIDYTIIDNQVVFHKEDAARSDTISVMQPGPVVVRSIRGQVLSGSDNAPLEFSTIWIPSTWEGTVANTEGQFILKITGSRSADSLAVSCMGYRSKIIPLTQLNDSLNLIYLQPAIIPIQEVVIRRTDPIALILQALEKIPDNYFRKAVIETAFYRESILKNNHYINVSEAVLDIYKPAINALTSEQVKVLKGRSNMDYSEMDTIMIKLQAGLESSFLLDITRNQPDFLVPEKFHQFEYRMSDIVTMQGKSTYAIDFWQKPNSPFPHYRGLLYIDLETLAFRGVEFEVDPRSMSEGSPAMVVKKPRNLKVKPLSASYQVTYKEKNHLFYVSRIMTDVSFRVRERGKIFGTEYQTISEMAITQLQTEKVTRFRNRETVRITDVFADMLGGYDEAFWGPYNYLIPEESLEDALERISSLMESSSGPELP